METIREILIRRDGYNEADCDEALEIARERIAEGENPEEVLLEEFGLEPDYIFDKELGLL